jgi:hypothetical protein
MISYLVNTIQKMETDQSQNLYRKNELVKGTNLVQITEVDDGEESKRADSTSLTAEELDAEISRTQKKLMALQGMRLK